MQQELTPEEIEQATFTIGMRGYDKQEVEGFLADVADQIRVIADTSRSAYVDLGEEMGELLQHARNSADEMTRKAEEEATALRAKADSEATDSKRAADEYVKRANDDIGEEVKRIREGAEEQARAIIHDAQQRIVILQREEAEARERIRALRLQLLEVTLNLQRFEVAEESPEGADAEEVEEFHPTTAGLFDDSVVRPTGDAFETPAEPGNEVASEGAPEEEAAGEAEVTQATETVDFASRKAEVVDLDEHAEESRR